MGLDPRQFPPRTVNEVQRFLFNLMRLLEVKGARQVAGALAPILGDTPSSTDPIGQYQLESEKGQPNGYASLDATGVVPIEQLPASVGGAAQGTYLVSGGQVTWQSGLSFLVAAGSGYIDGTLLTWIQQTVTLDASDPSNPRIDVIYIGTSGTADSITGTAAPDPSEPVVDPATQLRLALVTVAANATEPAVSSEVVYAENAGAPAEWAWTASDASWNVNSTTFPFAGTKAIEGTSVVENAYVQGQRGSGSIDPADYTQLVLYLQIKAAWGSGRYLQVTLRNAGVQVGNGLRVSPGFFGLDGDNTFSYQAVIIPVLQFAAPAGSTVNQVRVQAIGSGGDAIGCHIDGVSFTTGGASGVGGEGITEAEADARYLQQANNLSDLGNAATARTNLGVTHANLPDVTADQHHAKAHAHDADGSGTVAHSSLSGLTTGDPHTQYQREVEKGVANGYASLGADGLVPQNQLGTGTQDGTRFLRDDGTWQVVSAASLTVREVDGSPSITAGVIEFPEGTLTDQGSGVARYSPSVTGRYRQFVTEVSGGDFTFLRDSSGNPIYALAELE